MSRHTDLYLVGLTGNIACGKSTVLALLEAHGAQTIDADRVTHRVQQPGTPVYQQIVAAFGTGIVSAPAGPIDRRALGGIVFSDPAALQRLEGIVHPAVHAEIRAWLAGVAHTASPERTKPVAVIDAVKLLESGWKRECDTIWVVTCTPEQQQARLIATRGMSAAEAQQRITAQSPQAEKAAQADVVIDNSDSLDATRAQVDAAWQRIMGDGR